MCIYLYLINNSIWCFFNGLESMGDHHNGTTVEHNLDLSLGSSTSNPNNNPEMEWRNQDIMAPKVGCRESNLYLQILVLNNN